MFLQSKVSENITTLEGRIRHQTNFLGGQGLVTLIQLGEVQVGVVKFTRLLSQALMLRITLHCLYQYLSTSTHKGFCFSLRCLLDLHALCASFS